MRRATKILIAAAVVVLLAGGVGWFLYTRGDAPPPPSFSALTSRAGTATTSAGTGTSGASGLEGEWTVGKRENTFVGYKVSERLSNLPARNTAFGRTPAVEGSMTIASGKVATARVTADLRQLASDRPQRDNAIRDRGLESDTFPEAIFELREPADIGTPALGQEVLVPVRGRLTLHGVTNDVDAELKGRWDGAVIEVIGSIPILFADYNITAPRLGPVVEIDENGTVEISIVFERRESGD